MGSNNRCLVSEMSKLLLAICGFIELFREPSKAELVTTGAYGIVRHPAMSCLIGVFLITPTMVTYPISMHILLFIISDVECWPFAVLSEYGDLHCSLCPVLGRA